MIKNKIVYGLITARGGSKGIPHKNIYPLNGKPLIAYTIEAALKSKYVDRLIVSTDDKKIAEVSKNFNAEVPFIRPDSLSGDLASSASVIEHAITYFANENKSPDLIILLQPTSPLRETYDIDDALETFIKSDAESLISVCKTEQSPYWFKKFNNEGFISDFIPQPSTYIRRQDTPDLYILNGAIYILNTKSFLSSKIILGDKSLPYIMPKERSVDIDTMLDIDFAEFLLKRVKN